MERNRNIGQQVTNLLVTIFIVMLIIGMLMLFFIRQQYDKRLYMLCGWNASHMTSDIDYALSNTASSGELFLSETVLIENVKELRDAGTASEKASAELELEHRLRALVDSIPHIVEAAVSTGSAVVRAGADDGSGITDLAAGIVLSGSYTWISGEDNDDVFYVHKIQSDGEDLGVLLLRMDLGSLIRELWAESGFLGAMKLYYEGSLMYEDEFRLSQEITDGNGVTYIHAGTLRYYVHKDVLALTGWNYTFYSDTKTYGGGTESIFYSAITLLLMMMLISIVALHSYMNPLLESLHAIFQKMDRFGSGNTDFSDLPSYSDRQDEIGELHRRFDIMVVRYNDMVKSSYTKEILARDTMIQMLTQQINPHFLYNVLDSIYWLAEKYKAEDIANMSYSLASLLRGSSSSEIVLRLGRELELTQHYVAIQMIRFSDYLSFEHDIPDNLMKTLVPRFSIQPLVENAVKHAIEENGEICRVILSAYTEGEDVVIEVRNTGSLFPEHMEPEKGKGIGLKNINKRLSLIFGSAHRLDFHNDDGFAVVSFRVPKEYTDD